MVTFRQQTPPQQQAQHFPTDTRCCFIAVLDVVTALKQHLVSNGSVIVSSIVAQKQVEYPPVITSIILMTCTPDRPMLGD